MNSPAHLPLGGRVAVVTGSARNIGRAIAMRLASDGASVVINARSRSDQVDETVQAIRAAGGNAVGCLADVSDPLAVDRLMDTAVREFGGIDILVNNAAVRREGALERTTLEEWHQILGIILDGAFLCAQRALPYLRQSDQGRIVNIGGMTAGSGANHRVHVVTGKAGLEGLTKALAWDLAADGILVNLIHPGMMDTQRDTASVPEKPKHHAIHKPLVDRRGKPEELAGMAAALCGPDGGFVTGQTLHINGGAYLP